MLETVPLVLALRCGLATSAHSFRTLLCQDRLDHVAGDIGQAEVAAVVAVGQLRVVEAEQVQDRGVQVVDADAVDDGLVADLVGLRRSGRRP